MGKFGLKILYARLSPHQKQVIVKFEGKKYYRIFYSIVRHAFASSVSDKYVTQIVSLNKFTSMHLIFDDSYNIAKWVVLCSNTDT